MKTGTIELTLGDSQSLPYNPSFVARRLSVKAVLVSKHFAVHKTLTNELKEGGHYYVCTHINSGLRVLSESGGWGIFADGRLAIEFAKFMSAIDTDWNQDHRAICQTVVRYRAIVGAVFKGLHSGALKDSQHAIEKYSAALRRLKT